MPSRLGATNTRPGKIRLASAAGATAATAITLVGPSTGAVGVASTAFTVGANGAITGTVVVTPSSGGGGGTFSPTTVSINTGSPTGTFIYTPASSGAKTISVTNNGSLTNPSNITYTVYALATAYTFSGPSSGFTSAPSTVFTVALPASTVLATTVTVTPSAGAGGGSFSPASVSFPINTVAGSVTFTYTPTTIGVKTLSVTNNGGLSNPSNLTYTANAPADPNLLLFMDASNIAGADGDAIGTWSDSSGLAHDATQATAANKPTLRLTTNGINGLPGLSFDGTDYLATGSFLTSAEDVAFYAEMVLQRTAGQTAEQTVLSFGADQMRVTVQGAIATVNKQLDSLVPGPFVKVYAPSGMSPGIYNSGSALVCSSRVTGSADRIELSVSYDGSHFRVGCNGLWNQTHYPLANIAAASGNAAGNLGLTGGVTIGAKSDGTNAFVGLISHAAVYKAAQDYSALKSKALSMRQIHAIVPQRVLFAVGDSTTSSGGPAPLAAAAQWPAQLLVVTPVLTATYDIVNLGVGGSTSADWLKLHLYERAVFGSASDRIQQVAVVMGFGNDTQITGSYGAVDEGRALYQQQRSMCDILKKEGVQIVVCTILPRGSTSGTATAGDATHITLQATASTTDSIYNGLKIVIYAGTGVGQVRTISAYTGSTRIATVSASWTTNPDATSQYAVGPIPATDRILLSNALTVAYWPEYADALCDIAADSLLSDPTNPTYFQDGVHETAAGATRIAQLVNPVLNALALPASTSGGAGRRRFQ